PPRRIRTPCARELQARRHYTARKVRERDVRPRGRFALPCGEGLPREEGEAPAHPYTSRPRRGSAYRRTGVLIEPVTASAGVGCQAASFCSAAPISPGSMRALICSRRRADSGSPELALSATHS